jgi:hypothetical protein
MSAQTTTTPLWCDGLHLVADRSPNLIGGCVGRIQSGGNQPQLRLGATRSSPADTVLDRLVADAFQCADVIDAKVRLSPPLERLSSSTAALRDSP